MTTDRPARGDTGEPTDRPPAPGSASERREPAPPSDFAGSGFAGWGPFLTVFVPLLLFWIVLSGKFDALHLIPGIAAAAGAARVTVRLLALPPAAAPGAEIARLPRKIHHLLAYGVWLAGQILGSALRVARVVLDPRLPVAPELVRVEDRLPWPLSRLALAHSITLTPGTVTLDADERGLTIHALDADSAAAVAPDGGKTGERLARLLGR